MTKPAKRVRFRAPRVVYNDRSVSCIKLLKVLKQVQDKVKNGSVRSNFGICFHVDELLDGNYGYLFLEVAFKGWMHHSGNHKYPVPHPTRVGEAWAERAYGTGGNYMWKGSYGDLRKNLLQYTINKMETKIAQAKAKQGF